MGNLDIDVSEVKKLIELVETYGLEELTVEEADLRVVVRGARPARQTQAAVHPGAHAASPEPAGAPQQEAADEGRPAEPAQEIAGNIVDIRAPLVGVFYRAPAPDAPAFVEVEDTIEVGTEVGVIEAMKVFSPIPSEVAGEVVEIPAENGKLVHEGDVLVRVRVLEERSQ